MHIQSRKELGLCNVLCKRFSKKCFTQIYMVLNEDAMLVSLWGSQIWQLEATTSPTRTVQTAQSQQLSHLLTYVTAFKYRATLRKLINSTLWYQKMKDLKNWNLLKDKSSAVLVTNLTKISRIDNSFFFFFNFDDVTWNVALWGGSEFFSAKTDFSCLPLHVLEKVLLPDFTPLQALQL